MMRMQCVLIGIVGTSLAAAADWPQFRGPDGQGHTDVADLPLTWSATDNVRWKADLPGVGWSSPVVVDGAIYLTTAVPQGSEVKPDQSLRVLCLDAATGTPRWNVEVLKEIGADAPNIHKNSHASPSVLVEAGRVYAHFGHMGTACLDAENGAILWKNNDHPYTPVHGNGSSPVLWGDLLIFSADGGDVPAVIALKKKPVSWPGRSPVSRMPNASFPFARR